MKIGTPALIGFLLGAMVFPGQALAFQPPRQEGGQGGGNLTPETISSPAPDAAFHASSAPPAPLQSSLAPEFADRQFADPPPALGASKKAEFQQALGGGRGPASGPPLRLHSKESSPPRFAPSPAPINNAAPAPAAAPVLAIGAPSIVGIRLGRHPDMLRVVIDLSAKADYSYVISEAGTAVMIGFSGIDWRAGAVLGQGQGLIADYLFTKNAGGGLVNLNAHVPVGVKQAFGLAPTDGRGYRIVLDLVDARNPGRDSESDFAPVNEASAKVRSDGWKQGLWSN